MSAKILEGNVLETLKDLPACSVQCVVTSPPYYGLRDYGMEGQIGLEETPEAYVESLVAVFREVWRVLKNDGVLWLNLGDSYWANRSANGEAGGVGETSLAGSENKTRAGGKPHPVIKPKDLIGIPWMVAFALRAEGWYLRQDIIWSKPNPMPESVTDRCTKSHEYIFLLTKNRDYYYDFEAILEPANYDGRKATKMQGSKKYQNGFAPTDDNPNTLHVKGHERWSRTIGRTERKMEGTNYGGDGKGLHGHSGYYDKDGNPRFNTFEDGTPARNKRSVWHVSTKPYKEAHFATFPTELIEPCILAGTKEGDTVLDPFNGSGTTGEVSIKYHRLYIGCELNPKYVKLTHRRLSQVQPVLMQGRSLTPREPDNGDSAPSQAFSTPDFLSDLEGLS